MVLAIYAARHADQEYTDPVTTVLSAEQCTIGRGNECDIVLEDQTRRVSRQHVAVLRRGGSYSLHVISQINPAVVNGEVVAPGAQQALRAGDRLIIGEYEFGFVSVEEPEPISMLPANPVARSDKRVDLDVLFGARSEPQAAPAAKLPPSDLHDLLGSRETRAPDPLLDALGRGGDAARRPATSADPLAQILGHGPGSAPASTGSPDEFLHGGGGESPIDALLKGSGMPGSDVLGLSRERPLSSGQGRFGGGVGGSDELDHVHDVHLPFPSMPSPAQPAVPNAGVRRRAPAPALPPQAAPTPVPLADADSVLPPMRTPLSGEYPLAGPAPAPTAGPDPLAAILGDAATRPPPADPLGLFGTRTEPSADAQARVLPETPLAIGAETVRSPYRSPAQLREQPAPAMPYSSAPVPAYTALPSAPAASAQAAPAPPAEGAAMDAALTAFLRGAGMQSVDFSQADTDALLAECGATVRAAIEGLMGMMLARAKVREELRAVDRTMVAARENNALKLAESVDEALQFVFDPAARSDAFLPPSKAVADACADLQTHEFALVAGMRAALLGAIKRFEPEVIEKRLQKEGGKSLLANRKAQLWDCFVAYYQQTQTEADDNFDRVFGAAFLRAYQEQIRRLSR